jgi:hypothetical protein
MARRPGGARFLPPSYGEQTRARETLRRWRPIARWLHLAAFGLPANGP